MDFTTTREANGAIKTSTPGYEGASPVGAGGDFGSAIADILKQRRQVPRPQPRTPRVAVAQQAAPGYVPTMGQAPITRMQAPITRMREIPQNPYDAMSRIPGGIGGTGHTNTARVERYIPGVGWEFEGLYDQKGGSGGFAGGGALSTLHASENLGLPDQRAGFSSSNPVAAGRQAAGFDGKVRKTQRDKNGKIIE